MILAADLGDVEACRRLIDDAHRALGRLDVLINCANEMFIGSVEEATVAEVMGLYDTNVFGVMRLCKQVAPVMRQAVFSDDAVLIIRADKATSHGLFAGVYAEAKRAGIPRIQFATESSE